MNDQETQSEDRALHCHADSGSACNDLLCGIGAPDSMEELGFGMSNFSHSIDDGLADALRDSAGKAFGRYDGWNFYAKVWFWDELFRAEVWTYRVPREVITGETLEELMSSVCSAYGSD